MEALQLHLVTEGPLNTHNPKEKHRNEVRGRQVYPCPPGRQVSLSPRPPHGATAKGLRWQPGTRGSAAAFGGEGTRQRGAGSGGRGQVGAALPGTPGAGGGRGCPGGTGGTGGTGGGRRLERAPWRCRGGGGAALLHVG